MRLADLANQFVDERNPGELATRRRRSELREVCSMAPIFRLLTIYLKPSAGHAQPTSR